MRFSCLLFMLLLSEVTFAQQQLATDAPSAADTIGISRQRALFSVATTYSFHAARQLSGLQLMPLLSQVPDEQINRLMRRSRRRYQLAAPLFIGSYGLLVGATRAFAVNQESALGAGLTLGSLAAITDGIVLSASAPRPMWRAVSRYNQLLMTSITGYAYARPRYVPAPDVTLTEADTIHIRARGLGSRYLYRGISLAPDSQLQAAMLSLQDPFMTEGLRQNRVTRGVAGLIGAFSATFLSSYYLSRWINQAAGRNVPRPGALIYVSLGGVVTSAVMSRLTDRTTRQVVKRYNQRLRDGRDWQPRY